MKAYRVKAENNIHEILPYMFIYDAWKHCVEHYSRISSKALDIDGRPSAFVSQEVIQVLEACIKTTSRDLSQTADTFLDLLPTTQAKQAELLIRSIPRSTWNNKIQILTKLLKHPATKNRLKTLLERPFYVSLMYYLNYERSIENTLQFLIKSAVYGVANLGMLYEDIFPEVAKRDARVIRFLRQSKYMSEEDLDLLNTFLDGGSKKLNPQTDPGHFTRSKPYKLLIRPIPPNAIDLEVKKPIRKDGQWTPYAKWYNPETDRLETTYLKEHFDENLKYKGFYTALNNAGAVRNAIFECIKSDDKQKRILGLMLNLVRSGYFAPGNKYKSSKNLLTYQVKDLSFMPGKVMLGDIPLKLSSTSLKILADLARKSSDEILFTYNKEPVKEKDLNRIYKECGGKGSPYALRFLAANTLFKQHVKAIPPGFERWSIIKRLGWCQATLAKLSSIIEQKDILNYLEPESVTAFKEKYGLADLPLLKADPLGKYRNALLELEAKKGFIDSNDIRGVINRTDKPKPKKKLNVTIKKVEPQKFKEGKPPHVPTLRRYTPSEDVINRVAKSKNKLEALQRLKKNGARIRFKNSRKIYEFSDQDIERLEEKIQAETIDDWYEFDLFDILEELAYNDDTYRKQHVEDNSYTLDKRSKDLIKNYRKWKKENNIPPDYTTVDIYENTSLKPNQKKLTLREAQVRAEKKLLPLKTQYLKGMVKTEARRLRLKQEVVSETGTIKMKSLAEVKAKVIRLEAAAYKKSTKLKEAVKEIKDIKKGLVKIPKGKRDIKTQRTIDEMLKTLDWIEKKNKLYNQRHKVLRPKGKKVTPKVKDPSREFKRQTVKLAKDGTKNLKKNFKIKLKSAEQELKMLIKRMRQDLKGYDCLVPVMIEDNIKYFAPYHRTRDYAIKVSWQTLHDSKAFAGRLQIYLDENSWLVADFHKSQSKWHVYNDNKFGLASKMIRYQRFNDNTMLNVIKRFILSIQKQVGDLEDEKPALEHLAKELKAFKPMQYPKENKLFIGFMAVEPVLKVLESAGWLRLKIPEILHIHRRDSLTRYMLKKGRVFVDVIERGHISKNIEIYLSVV